ncbi:MAG: sigma-70 family RNA polymerase sigma factor [Myxococcota bacterium]|nr:sigma-70 family RNA polymerase sigma factor [Myxococcota bacterium]
MTDGDLLRDDARTREAFKRGDRWALTEVYRVYYPLVTTVVTRGFGGFRGFFNPADRDDAIQSIFAAAFEQKARLRYNGLDPYTAFLRGIAQNVVRRMLERRTKFMRTDGQPELEHKEVETAEAQFLDAEAIQVVRAFRETIQEPVQRQILASYFVDGDAEETIAKDLGITRYKVRKTISLLDRRMRRYLKQHGLP